MPTALDDHDPPEDAEFTPPAVTDAGDPNFDSIDFFVIEERDGREVSVPPRTSRMYQGHCRRRLRMTAEEVKSELRRVVNGSPRKRGSWTAAVKLTEPPADKAELDFGLVMKVVWDVRWQPAHWLKFKTDSAKGRDHVALKLIADVEQRFRPYEVGKAGRPRTQVPKHSMDADVLQNLRDKAPYVRAAMKTVSRHLRREELNQARTELRQVCEWLGLSHTRSAKAIHTFIDGRKPIGLLPQRPQYIVNQLLAWTYGLRLNDVGRAIASKPRSGRP